MGKGISILWLLKFRKAFSMLYLLFSIALFNILSVFNNMNEKYKVIFGILIILLVTIKLFLLVALSNSIVADSDPINFRYRKKYLIVFIIESGLMFIDYYFINIYSSSIKITVIYDTLLILIMIFVYYINMHIINDYLLLEKEEVSKFINKYKIYISKSKEEMVEKLCKKLKYAFIYIIIVMLFYKNFVSNIYAFVFFIIINTILTFMLFREGYQFFYYNKFREIMIGSLLISILGNTLAFLIYNKILIINFLNLNSRTAEELFVLYIIFGFQYFVYLKKILMLRLKSKTKWIH